MANSVQTSILNDIVTTIGAIAAGATYTRTVRCCSRNVKTLANVPTFDAVWIAGATSLKTIPLNSAKVEVVMTVTLMGVVQDHNDLGAAVDALEADIEKALMVDYTRGGYAIDSRVVRTEEIAFEAEEPLAGIEMDVQVIYRHLIGDPYTKC